MCTSRLSLWLEKLDKAKQRGGTVQQKPIFGQMPGNLGRILEPASEKKKLPVYLQVMLSSTWPRSLGNAGPPVISVYCWRRSKAPHGVLEREKCNNMVPNITLPVCSKDLVGLTRRVWDNLGILDTTTMAPKSSRSRPYLLMIVTLVITIILFSLITSYSKLYETILHPVCAEYAPLPEATACINSKSSEEPAAIHYSTTLFEPHPKLENLSSAKDETWAQSLLTPKGGFLWVKLNETSERAWGISMFHGLHCLQTLRGVIQRGEADDPGHIGHCIGYIAQVR